MSLRLQFYLLTILFTALFTPFGMTILDEKQQINSSKLAIYKEAEGSVVSATKVTRRRSGSSVDVTYNFSAANGRTYSGLASMTTDDWKAVEASLAVRVLYDPSAPQHNNLAGQIENLSDERPFALRASVGAIFGMPLGLALAGLWVWLARRRKAVPSR